jgi:hypothetical protein
LRNFLEYHNSLHLKSIVILRFKKNPDWGLLLLEAQSNDLLFFMGKEFYLAGMLREINLHVGVLIEKILGLVIEVFLCK